MKAGGQQYTYDALGRRTQVIQVAPGTDPAISFYYSAQHQVLEERESGGSLAKRQNVWGLGYIDDLILRDRDTASDGVLDERLYVLHDANFNVTSVVDDASDAVVERYVYDPYGTPKILTAAWADDLDQISDVGMVYLHQGGRWDRHSKLYHFRGRDFNAELGRFTRQDPKGYVDGANLYQYELSSPAMMLDPIGTDSTGYSGSDHWKQQWKEKQRIEGIKNGPNSFNPMAKGGPATRPTTGPASGATTCPSDDGCPRSPTPEEIKGLQKDFPNLDPDTVLIIGPPARVRLRREKNTAGGAAVKRR